MTHSRFSFLGARRRITSIGRRFGRGGKRFGGVAGRVLVEGGSRGLFGLSREKRRTLKRLENKLDKGLVLTEREQRQYMRLSEKATIGRGRLTRAGRVGSRILLGGERRRLEAKRLFA